MKNIIAVYGFLIINAFSGFAQYCNLSGTCGVDRFRNVSVNGFHNFPDSCNGYDFFENVKMQVEIGTAFDIQASWFVYTDAAAHVFIDWNNSGTWDSDEYSLIGDGLSRSASTKVIVPATVTAGQSVRMRIILSKMNETPDPCSGNPSGGAIEEVHDYNIQIVDEIIDDTRGTEYCRAYGESCGFGGNGWISRVDVTGTKVFSNSSGCGDGQATGYNFYEDSLIEMSLNGVENITVSISGNQAMAGMLFIDFNQNGSFEDEGEELSLVGGAYTGTLTSAIVVPATAKEGFTRMRILIYDPIFQPVYYGMPNACAILAYGEVEDYRVLIGQAPPSPPDCAVSFQPVDSTENICLYDGLTLKWEPPTSGPVPIGYKLSFGTNNPPTDIIANFDVGNSNSFVISDSLSVDTRYYWKVTPYDSAGGDAKNCPVNTFMTASNEDPTVQITVDGEFIEGSELCEQQSLIVSANLIGGAGPFQYKWFGSDSTDFGSTTVSSTSFAPKEPDLYTIYLEVVDANGCMEIDSLTVNVHENAFAGRLSGDTTICSGDPITLKSDSTSGSLKWEVLNDNEWEALPGEDQGEITLNGLLQESSFRLIAISPAGCNDTSSQVTISVFEGSIAPEVSSSSGILGFCNGDSLVLSSSIEENNIWSTGASTQEIVLYVDGEIWLMYQDQNGCLSDTGFFEIEKFPTPQKPIIINQPGGTEMNICSGDTVVLSIANTEENIEWDGNPNLNDDSLIVTTSGSHFVRVWNDFGCSAVSNSLFLRERPLPAKPNIESVQGTFEFCEGDSIELIVQSSEAEFTWNVPFTAPGNFVWIKDSREITVTAVNSFGCLKTSDSIETTLKVKPIRPIVLGGASGNDSTYCDNDSLLLVADAILEPVWLFNGDSIFYGDTLYVSEPGEYQALVLNEFGCSNTSFRFGVEENALPKKPEISLVDGKLVTSNDAGFIQWYFATGESIIGATEPSLEVEGENSYLVSITDTLTGCSNFSEVFLVTGIYNEDLANQILVYPNPTDSRGIVMIEAPYREIRYVLLASDGRVIQKGIGNKVSLKSLASGMYQLVIYSDNHLKTGVTKKLIVN